jgi:hypothetical protein
VTQHENKISDNAKHFLLFNGFEKIAV